MSEIKRPLKVFLYHTAADKSVVRNLYLRLMNDGVDAWLVKDKLLPGQDWKQELHKSVCDADVIAVCISERFDKGESRQREVRLALDTVVAELKDEIFVIPVCLEEGQIPGSLKTWHGVNLFEENGYDELLSTLHLRANMIGATIETKESLLPQITIRRVNDEQPVAEEKPAEVRQRILEVVEGAGLLIEGHAVKQPKPGRAIILALLGFAVITMMALFGPVWIENSTPLTSTPGLTATPLVGNNFAQSDFVGWMVGQVAIQAVKNEKEFYSIGISEAAGLEAIPTSTPITSPVQGPAVLGDNVEIEDWQYLGPESIESFPSLSANVREVGRDIYLVQRDYGFDLVWSQVVCATQPVVIVHADAVIEFWPAAKVEPCEAMGVGHMLTVQWESDIPFDEWKFIFHPPPEPEA